MPKNILHNAFNLAQKYGTPLYVYDFDKITRNVEAFKTAFNARKSLLCYALKANSNLSLLKHLANLKCGADCVSINEVKRALLAGIPKYKIIYSGVGKDDSDIQTALDLDILFINVESEEEMLRIETLAREANKTARISIRVNPNIDAKTHPYISTGLRENKFGVDIECAKKMFIYAKNSANLAPIAVHFHIGSQLLDLAPITQSAEKIVGLIKGLLALKIDIKFIDIGGGLGISYNGEKIIDFYDYAQGILGALKGLDLTIISELGRRIVGDCGVLLTRILYEKENEFKRFCIVDAAMNDLIRPALYGAKHRVVLCEGNSSLDLHSADSANFECSQTPSLASHSKFAESHESQAENLSVVDSAHNAQNLVKNHSSLRGQIADSTKAQDSSLQGKAEAIQRNSSDSFESSAKSCHIERSEISKNLGESKISKTPPPNPLPQGEGDFLECGAKPQPPLTFCRAKSKQKNANSRESKNFFAYFFSKKVSGLQPKLKNNTPPPFGRGLGGGVNSQNPNDSCEYTNLSESQNSLDCHALPNGKSRNDSMGNSHESTDSPQDKATFADIVGPICESSDYLAKDIALPRTNRGDILAILDSGAYGFSMASNYNSRLKCAEVALENGKSRLIRQRETFDESIANEISCIKDAE